MRVKEDFYDLVHAIGSRRFWLTLAVTWVGLMIYSIGVNALVVPHKFIASGATGISLLVYYLLGAPSIGVIYWLVNLPILLLGWRVMSLKFVFVALIGVLMSGVTLQLTQQVRIGAEDPLMAAILAGVFTGGGCGLYLRFGGSAGGIDIVAAAARRRFGLPMGRTIMAVNGLIFALGSYFHPSLERAFYSAIAMAVHAKVIDKVQAGFSSRKAALIITRHPQKVAEQILRRLRRGVTFLDGSGGMTSEHLKVIYTVVNMVEVARLKELIFHCDEAAFVSLTDVSEVIGKRFLTWSSQGFDQPDGGHSRHVPPPPAGAGTPAKREAAAG